MSTPEYVVVGAGLFGSVIAEQIANRLQRTVLVIDKRTEPGGNCHSAEDPATGIEYHTYGTHIFHTSSTRAWDYIRRFTDFNGYHHQVLTVHRGGVYQMPINLETINAFYGKNFRPAEARAFVAAEIAAEDITNPRNLEEKAISLVGRPLYEAFIRGYTIKQWHSDPRHLPAEIITRLPVRFDYREDYFTDAFRQGIPLRGYTTIFERMLTSPLIETRLGCDYFKHREQLRFKRQLIFSGPIDSYFDASLGPLQWRSVRQEKKIVDEGDFQGTSVMNYADLDVPFTRIHEPRHLHPERSYPSDRTVIFYETPCDDPSEPLYPIKTGPNLELLTGYRELASRESRVVFGGRLGDYAYYDMDKTILRALECFEKEIVPFS